MITTRPVRFAVAFVVGALLVLLPASLAGAQEDPDQRVSNQPMADADEDGLFEPAPAADSAIEGEAEITVEPVLENAPADTPRETSRGIGRTGIIAGLLVAGAAGMTAFAVLRRDRLVMSA